MREGSTEEPESLGGKMLGPGDQSEKRLWKQFTGPRASREAWDYTHRIFEENLNHGRTVTVHTDLDGTTTVYVEWWPQDGRPF